MRKYLIFTGLLFVMAISASGKTKPRYQPNFQVPVKHDTIVVSKRDTVYLKTIENESHMGFDLSKNMPWIGAILIGLTTVAANLLISSQSRKSNGAVAQQQIDNVKTIALEQMDLTRINSQRDFNKTVFSASRQAWISDLRGIISELLSLIAIFSLNETMAPENFQKLHLLVSKAELMLNLEPNQIKLKAYLTNLKLCCSAIMMQNKTIDDLEPITESIRTTTADVIKDQWDKASIGI